MGLCCILQNAKIIINKALRRDYGLRSHLQGASQMLSQAYHIVSPAMRGDFTSQTPDFTVTHNEVTGTPRCQKINSGLVVSWNTALLLPKLSEKRYSTETTFHSYEGATFVLVGPSTGKKSTWHTLKLAGCRILETRHIKMPLLIMYVPDDVGHARTTGQHFSLPWAITTSDYLSKAATRN